MKYTPFFTGELIAHHADRTLYRTADGFVIVNDGNPVEVEEQDADGFVLTYGTWSDRLRLHGDEPFMNNAAPGNTRFRTAPAVRHSRHPQAPLFS